MNLIKTRLKGNRGFTIIELLIVICIIGILTRGGVSVYTSYTNKANEAVVLGDFSSLKTACSQLLYENGGLGKIDEGDFYKVFNKYIDSNCSLESDNITLGQNDPWKAPYVLKFEQISSGETKIHVDSVGKSKDGNSAMYSLLVHYKAGEVRTGTAGFQNDEGEKTSDAAVDENGVATITNMWVK